MPVVKGHIQGGQGRSDKTFLLRESVSAFYKESSLGLSILGIDCLLPSFTRNLMTVAGKIEWKFRWNIIKYFVG